MQPFALFPHRGIWLNRDDFVLQARQPCCIPSKLPRQIVQTPGARTLRRRSALMDFEALAAARAHAERGENARAALDLNLFDDARFKTVSLHAAPTRAGYTLSGPLENVPFGTVSLAVNGGGVAGSVQTSAASFAIRSTGDGYVAIEQVVPPPLECGVRSVARNDPQGTGESGRKPYASAAPRASAADEEETTVIDLLVLYTPAAKEEMGGRVEMETTLDHWVAVVNHAYRDSGIQQKVNLVHAEEVEVEDDAILILDQLEDIDGPLVDVHALRDRLGADLVYVVSSGVSDCFGVATKPYRPSDFHPNVGFGVVAASCGGDVLAHEVGHNMGVAHDRFENLEYLGFNTYPYSHGYVNQAAFEPDAPVAARWYTIMAYEDQCIHEGISHCRRLPRFSNPDQTHLGDPLGVDGDTETYAVAGPADARRNINNTRSLVADYREPRPVLGLVASASALDLETGQSSTLRAELRHRGSAASAATTVSFHRSADPTVTVDDEELGTAAVDELAASAARSLSLEVDASAEGGDYYYGACVDGAEALNPCSTVHVAVGPRLAIGDARAGEGEEVEFEVNLSAARSTDISVRWEVSSGTAALGADIAPDQGGTLTIPAGRTRGTVSVATVADTVAEPEDSFTVALVDVSPDAPEGAVLSLVASHASGTIADDDGELAIPDANLRLALEAALRKRPEEPILAADLATLRELDWSHERRSGLGHTEDRIADLTGLEFASALRTVDLGSNRLADVSPLAHLPNLGALELGGNGIEDVSPLAHLTKLAHRGAGGTSISDITSLARLTKLRTLELSVSRVSDLDPIKTMTELRVLHLSNNPIRDISPLAGLTRLVELWLEGTSSSDLSPLAGLTEMRVLWLRSNSITDLRPLAGMDRLSWLWLSNNPISDLSPLAELHALLRLDLNNTRVADLSPISGLSDISILDLGRSMVSDISPLKFYRQCTVMFLDSNGISDLSTLANLTGLGRLNLTNNEISDLTHLAELTSLGRLWLGNNRISDITPLGGLTELRRLVLADNEIADVSPLEGLVNLVFLDLAGNRIVDVAPLAGLDRLSELHLGDNLVTDVSALGPPDGLHQIYVQGNPLREESLEVHIPRLRDMGVKVYHIALTVSDASAREGESLETTARLSSVASEPVLAGWAPFTSDLGFSGDLSLVMLDLLPTATLGDVGWVYRLPFTIPANTTEATLQLPIPDDGVDEPNELFVIALLAPSGGLAQGVALSRNSTRILGYRSSQAVGLIVDADGSSHDVPLFAPAGHPTREGFARIVNHGRRTAVHVEALDEMGALHGPTTLSINRSETVHFNSGDLENGNVAKGLVRGVGVGDGDWRLKLSSEDIEVFSYMRTSDGFLTSMHDVAPRTQDGGHYVPTFNPADNSDQVSLLRLVNGGDEAATITIEGVDDDGVAGDTVSLSLDARTARTVSSQDLESGVDVDGALGDGTGKWRLTVDSDRPLIVASLLESPTGHLTNLSTVPVVEGDLHSVPLFPAASDELGRQGFARVINRGDSDAEVIIAAFDETDRDYGSVTLMVGANETKHFNSDDLELGNDRKGLTGSTGAGEGDWRLELTSEADIEVLSYIRTTDGFLTSMHDVVPDVDNRHRVPIFNPGRNTNQVSRLRLINAGDEAAQVTITGIDGIGDSPWGLPSPRGPPGRSRQRNSKRVRRVWTVPWVLVRASGS